MWLQGVFALRLLTQSGLVLLAQSSPGMNAIAASGLEGRPAAEAASPLQARVDAAAEGATIEIDPGRYVGDLYLDRRVHLVGRGRPALVGSGRGSVILVRAPGVVIEGIDIDARLGGSLDRDSSGVHVAAAGVVIRDVRIDRGHFGIYLLEADDATIERTVIRGVPNRPPGEQGSGVHLFNSQRFRLTGNDIADMRDGIYIQASGQGTVRNTAARRVRYGLHYMYADDNVFEDNRFEDSAAGAAIMYSKRLVFRRNRFVRNRGFASVGLLLKDCEDLVAEDNFIADNARGLFLEGSDGNTFRRNVVAVSDAALVIFGSSRRNRFEGNVFVGNLSPLDLVGRRTDTVFDGNYWSDADEPDLDGDGVRDRPFRLMNVFDHLRGNLTAADLFARSPAARALGTAERTFPVLTPIDVQDRRPLVAIPVLPDVPMAEDRAGDRSALAGIGVSGAFCLSGIFLVAAHRRSRVPTAEGRVPVRP
jgi:nitrous oxidase accessory protein